MKSCKKCNKEFEPIKGLVNFCSLACRNSREQTPEMRKKKSEAALNSDKVKEANRDSNRGKRPMLPRKHVTCLKCGGLIETKTHLNRKYHVECWKESSGGYRANSTIKHRSIYKGFQLDSGAEKLFAIILDELGVEWKKNTTEYFTYEKEGKKVGKYYPDFYLPRYGKWFEIKGKFYADKDKYLQQKLEAVENITIIYSTEISKQKVEQIIGSLV
jgi:hypothetical protein